MRTEKETIKDTLIKWGVIKDGKFLKDVFEKEVGASWMRKKIFEYGLDKEGLDIKETVNKAVEHIVEEVCPKCGKNPCECDDDKQTPAEAPVEEVKDETPAEDTKKKSTKKK